MEVKAQTTLAGFFACLLFSASAEACVGCGQSAVFSPKILAISMSFILLPATITLLIALRLRREKLADDLSKKTSASISSSSLESGS